jgi:Txe/YoeB family toxin of Txe-Axe toxin-antitoxin module
MVKKVLLDNLSRLGFSLMETKEDFDVNKTLAEVVKSKDTRLWEGFPVLLANAAQEYYFNYEQVLKNLTKRQEREDFHALLLLSLALYKYYNLSFGWSNRLKKRFSNQDLVHLQKLRNSLVHGKVASFGNKRFHSSRLKKTFSNYFEQDAEKTRQLKEKYEDMSLEYALSQLFSPKQKELFKKKLKGEPLKKTEREYYSRAVKKKVSALANPDLHRLAQKLMEY